MKKQKSEKSQNRKVMLNNDIKHQLTINPSKNLPENTSPVAKNESLVKFDPVVNLVKGIFTIDKLEVEVNQINDTNPKFEHVGNGNIKITDYIKIMENDGKPGRYIYYNGIKYGYYYYPTQKNSYLTGKVIHIGIANEIFYSNNWTENVKDFYSELADGGFPINKFYKIEVAFDTEMRVIDKIDKMKKSTELYRLKSGVKNIQQHKGETTLSHTFGDRYSDVYYAIYNKSKEIEKREKIYIRDYHQLNELTGRVERIELRLKGDELKKINISQDSLDSLNQQNFLGGIFNLHIDYLTFKHIGGEHFYVNGNKKYHEIKVIDIPDSPNTNILKNEMEKVCMAVRKANTNQKKSTLREVFFTVLESNNLVTKNFLKYYISTFDLIHYFKKMYSSWLKAYFVTTTGDFKMEYDRSLEVDELIFGKADQENKRNEIYDSILKARKKLNLKN